MNTDFIKTMFNADKVEMNFDDGKQIRIYYTKKDFISLAVDECLTDSDINTKALKNKKLITSTVNLINHVKKKKNFCTGINYSLEAYFGFKVGFDISIKDDIKISCLGHVFSFNLHPITEIKEPIITTVLDGEFDSKRKSIKNIKTSLPNAIAKTFSEEIDSIYLDELENTDEWIAFEDFVKMAYISYEEFKSEAKQYGFIYVNNCEELSMAEFISKTLDLSRFKISHDSKETVYSNGNKLFLLRDGNVEIYWSPEVFTSAIESMKTAKRVFCDIYREIIPYSPKNICFEIMEDGHLCVHTYGGYIKNAGCHKIYEFISSVKKHMDTEYTKEQRIIVDYLSSNMVGTIHQCMSLFGEISLTGLKRMCACRGENEDAAAHIYFSTPDILMSIQKMGFLHSWHINGNGSYNASFKEDELLLCECMENVCSIEGRKDYPFKDIVEMFPKEHVTEMLKDKGYVYKNTKDILQYFANAEFCNKYRTMIHTLLPNIDAKYYPLLRMQILKRNAKEVLGEDLIKEIRTFLEGH